MKTTQCAAVLAAASLFVSTQALAQMTTTIDFESGWPEIGLKTFSSTYGVNGSVLHANYFGHVLFPTHSGIMGFGPPPGTPSDLFFYFWDETANAPATVQEAGLWVLNSYEGGVGPSTVRFYDAAGNQLSVSHTKYWDRNGGGYMSDSDFRKWWSGVDVSWHYAHRPTPINEFVGCTNEAGIALIEVSDWDRFLADDVSFSPLTAIPGGPTLTLQTNQDQIVASWFSVWRGYVLQATHNTNCEDWTTISTTPTIFNGAYFVTNSLRWDGKYYRLVTGVEKPPELALKRIRGGRIVASWSAIPGTWVLQSTHQPRRCAWHRVKVPPHKTTVTNSIARTGAYFRLVPASQF